MRRPHRGSENPERALRLCRKATEKGNKDATGIIGNENERHGCLRAFGHGKMKFEKEYVKNADDPELEELPTFGDKDGFCAMMKPGTYAYRPFGFFSDGDVGTRAVHARSLKSHSERMCGPSRRRGQEVILKKCAQAAPDPLRGRPKGPACQRTGDDHLHQPKIPLTIEHAGRCRSLP